MRIGSLRLAAQASLVVMAMIGPRAAQARGLEVPVETYTLPNGLTVTLHVDHTLPRVVVNTWVAVGSKDEAPGRSGFAHLFEHLMFMGTERVPGNQFDVVMESGGGYNNASTSTDRTNYFSVGPSSLLPTLLWLDGDRLEALSRNMTQEKLDLQRDVVRNERREGENAPYGVAELLLPPAVHPKGHPYHTPIIGSHEDLEAAKLEDVIDFFDTYYVPSNMTLVVAGDFDPATVKPLIERTFGAVPARPRPPHRGAGPYLLTEEKQVAVEDRVDQPRLYLVWPSAPYMTEADGQLDLLSAILGQGPSSRLEKRLVLDLQLAQEVVAYQGSAQLMSDFTIYVTAREGVSLDRIKEEVLKEIEALKRDGPTEAEMQRVKAALESSFLRQLESLEQRADMINRYVHYWGMPDGFQRDLDRWTTPTAEEVRQRAIETLGNGRVDLRVLPVGSGAPGVEGALVLLERGAPSPEPDASARSAAAALLDKRPEDLPRSSFEPPLPETFRLSNGIPVHAVPEPGRRLMSGQLLVAGGEMLVSADKCGLAGLAARMLNSGAGGRDAAEFAQAVESLGATIRASAGAAGMRVRVDGLTSRMEETLDLFADAVLRPNLEASDFERESALALAAIESRADDPPAVAAIASRSLTFGEESPFGRPVGGFAGTVKTLALSDVVEALPRLLHPGNAQFVFVGDFSVDDLRSALEKRFGDWRSREPAPGVAIDVLSERSGGRMVFVDRPGAPQTVIQISRPVRVPEADERVALESLRTVFGGSFTSRLNQNLRERNGYTYGAFCELDEHGPQGFFYAAASVQTEVTAKALSEFRTEFDALARGNVTAEELAKSRETYLRRLVETAETTRALGGTIADLVANGRPMDGIRRELSDLEKVRLGDLNTLARSGLLDWGDLLVVLVGDKETVWPQLREAGFAEPQLASVEGKIGS